MSSQPDRPLARKANQIRVCIVGLHATGLALGRALRRLGHEPIGLYLDKDEPGRISSCFRFTPFPDRSP